MGGVRAMDFADVYIIYMVVRYGIYSEANTYMGKVAR